MKQAKLLAVVALCFLNTAVAADLFVTVAPVSELQKRMTIEFPASAEPLETSLLSSGISAEITAINARPGDRVPRGKTLIRLDCRDTRLRNDLAIQELRRAEVQLKFSRRQSARIARPRT